jgi:hypothetical protein
MFSEGSLKSESSDPQGMKSKIIESGFRVIPLSFKRFGWSTFLKGIRKVETSLTRES